MVAVQLNEAAPVAALARILIVDDNPVDVQIIRYALQEETDWATETTVASDGREAIDYLLNNVALGETPRPDLVILDLSLPMLDGTEILRVMQSSEALNDIPVLILSCYPESRIQKVMRDANLTAKAYLTKPSGIDEFAELGSKIRRCCTTREGQLYGRTTTS